MNSIKLQNRTDPIFMNLGNSKRFDPRIPFLNLSDKMNLKRGDKYVASSNRSIY